jgi:tetratricopeptide (TPR) repeat protein
MSSPVVARQSPHQTTMARMFAEVGQHLNRGEFPQAIEILERAHRLEPADYKIVFDLGYAQALAYDFEAAGRWFEKALQVAPDKAEVLMGTADRWLDVRNFDAAGKAFERVVEQGQVPVGAFYGLAKIYARQRRLDKAVETADRAMRMHGTHEAAMLTRAKVCRETGQLEEAERMLRAVVAKPGCDGEARATAFYELGGVLDQQRRYDEAELGRDDQTLRPDQRDVADVEELPGRRRHRGSL